MEYYGYTRKGYVTSHHDDLYGDMVRLMKWDKDAKIDKKVQAPDTMDSRLKIYYKDLYKLCGLENVLKSTLYQCSLQFSGADSNVFPMDIFVDVLEYQLLKDMLTRHHKMMRGVLAAFRRHEDNMPTEISEYRNLREVLNLDNKEDMYQMLDAAERAASVVPKVVDLRVFKVQDCYDIVHSNSTGKVFVVPKGTLTFYSKRNVESFNFNREGVFVSAMVCFDFYTKTDEEFVKKAEGNIKKVPKAAIEIVHKNLKYKYLESEKKRFKVPIEDLYVKEARMMKDSHCVLCSVFSRTGTQ